MDEEYDGFDAQVWRWMLLAVVAVSALSLAGVILIESLRAAGVLL